MGFRAHKSTTFSALQQRSKPQRSLKLIKNVHSINSVAKLFDFGEHKFNSYRSFLTKYSYVLIGSKLND